MPSYDRALTIFSPDGHLFQVEYALEAVNKGSLSVAIRGKTLLVLAAEHKTHSPLIDPRTVTKISRVDTDKAVTFAGLTADARALVNKARLESQSHQYTVNEPPSVDVLAQYIAREQQQFTQRGGRRPYGVSCLLAGFGTLKDPKLYLTEPSGAVSEWSACAVGRGHKEARKELERGRADLGEWADVSAERAALVAAALEALMTTAEAGGSGVEVAVLSRERLEFVQGDELNGAVARAEEALRGRKEEEKKQREMRGED